MAALTTYTATHTILETLVGALESSTPSSSLSQPSSSASSSSSIPPNPLLAYQPAFSRSLVVQLIVLSAILSLHLVLILHLAFTVRYHLPLAKGNYYLLSSGCIASFAATLWPIIEALRQARTRSRTWPFMFDYLEIMFPVQAWSMAKKVVWLVLNGFVGFLCHAAHIHMLTLLYPSAVETRLLMALLLPLALISTALSFSPLLISQREQDIFDSGAAVCNSTLTLLYTCALLFWGLYIARPRAWGKSDESGSTAVFGGCSIGMAIIGTVLSFVGVKRGGEAVGGTGNDGGWLAKVTWVVLLWQTWFGVWWWIGAGMYGAERPLDSDGEDAEGEAQDVQEDREQRQGLSTGSATLNRYVPDSLRLRRRKRRNKTAKIHAVDTSDDPGSGIESHEMRPLSRSSSTRAQPSSLPPLPPSDSSSSAATSTPPTLLNNLFKSIRRAHNRAAAKAHADLLQNVRENKDGVGEALSGRRKGGWSIGGILRSREKDIAQRAAKGDMSTGMRDELRFGAERLDDDTEEINNDSAARSGQYERTRRRPASPEIQLADGHGPGRARDEGWEDLGSPPTESRSRRAHFATQPISSPSGLQNSIEPQPIPTDSRRFQNWRRKDVTRYD